MWRTGRKPERRDRADRNGGNQRRRHRGAAPTGRRCRRRCGRRDDGRRTLACRRRRYGLARQAGRRRGFGSRERRRCRADLAVADRFDQGARRGVGRHRELVAQQARELAGALERGVAAAIARADFQRRALAVLARRVERHQPFRCLDGALAIVARVCVGAQQREGTRGRAGKALLLALPPRVELLDVEREIAQEGAAPQPGGARKLVRVGRRGDRQELARVHREGLRAQPDRLATHVEEVGRDVQILAQRQQTLAQAVARLRVRRVAPQQRRQLLAAGASIGLHRQIGEQPAGLARSDHGRGRAFRAHLDGERAQQAQRYRARFGHRSKALTA